MFTFVWNIFSSKSRVGTSRGHTVTNMLGESLSQPAPQQDVVLIDREHLLAMVDDPGGGPLDDNWRPEGRTNLEGLKDLRIIDTQVAASSNSVVHDNPMEVDRVHERVPSSSVPECNAACNSPGGPEVPHGDVNWQQVPSDLNVENRKLRQQVDTLETELCNVNSKSGISGRNSLNLLKENESLKGNTEPWKSRFAASLKQRKLLADQMEEMKKEIHSLRVSENEWIRRSQHFEQESLKLACQISSAESNQVRQKVELENRCEDLQKQLLTVELQRGKEAAASGLYVDSGATPLNLRTAAEGIKLSVQNFSRELMKFTNAEWKQQVCQGLLTKSGIKLSRNTDYRFWLQSSIVKVAFGHLWNPDHHFFFRCLPVCSNISQVQQHYFDCYKMLLAEANNIPSHVINLEVSPNSTGKLRICKEACIAEHSSSCGGVQFEQFCYRNIRALENMEIWQLVPRDEILRLREIFITFLLDVWLVHLLALAFEQPACLFEVERGQEFVEFSMENSVMLEDNQALRTVEFMIIPGFRVGRTVIKSQVYVVERK